MSYTWPRGFIRFSRCQFLRVPVRSGFGRVFAHGRAVATADGQVFRRASEKKRYRFAEWFSDAGKLFPLAIEAPAACLCTLMKLERTGAHVQIHFRRLVEKPEEQ